MPDLDALRNYVATVDRLSDARVQEPVALTELAVTLVPMWALGESLGPWPELTPAGPLDSLDPAL